MYNSILPVFRAIGLFIPELYLRILYISSRLAGIMMETLTGIILELACLVFIASFSHSFSL